LDNSDDEEQLQEFHTELGDRFGPIPQPVEDLFTTVRCRRMGIDLGFEKMLLKDGTMKGFFISNHESPYFQSPVFKKLLDFINTVVNNAKLKQVGKNGILIVDNIKTMNDLFRFLSRMHKFVMD
ncbi:MAG: transcription-repair coupling factor, partial [Sphingobacteriaceae bacterium]